MASNSQSELDKALGSLPDADQAAAPATAPQQNETDKALASLPTDTGKKQAPPPSPGDALASKPGEADAPAWMSQGPAGSEKGVVGALQPAPGTTYGSVLPLARDDATGKLRLAMPSALRDPLLDIAQGVGAQTTVDPQTGRIQYGASPGANALLAFGASPLRFGEMGPMPAPGMIDTTRAPPLTGINPPVMDVMRARQAVRSALTPPIEYEGAPPVPSTPLPSGFVQPTPAPVPGAPPPSAPLTVGTTPTTSAEALPVATGLLDKARASGASLQPSYVNKFVDKVTADAEPAGPGTAAVAGPNDPVATMVQRLQALRDQPLDIKDVMGMDQELNARQRAAIKTDPDLARRLGNLQDSLRDQVDAATAADVGGGADGWNAFQDGRAAYSQYKKMQAVEDMKERADGTQNPTSSYKTAVNNFVNGPKARGWSDDEIASLKDSADRGVIGGTVHLLGSRLIPLVAGGAGLTKYGATAAVASMVGAHYMGEMVRNVGNALQAGRVGRTMNVLGSSIPQSPLTPPPAP